MGITKPPTISLPCKFKRQATSIPLCEVRRHRITLCVIGLPISGISNDVEELREGDVPALPFEARRCLTRDSNSLIKPLWRVEIEMFRNHSMSGFVRYDGGEDFFRRALSVDDRTEPLVASPCPWLIGYSDVNEARVKLGFVPEPHPRGFLLTFRYRFSDLMSHLFAGGVHGDIVVRHE
jgi:hypothetical protein